MNKNLDPTIETDYKARLNQVFIFIDTHLDKPLSLEEVASVACFSPYHFHRIFKLMTGEKLHEYITRRRIEKAASELMHSRKSVLDITMNVGFSSNSSFTKAFKKYYDVSPSQFREQNYKRIRKISQVESKMGQMSSSYTSYICVMKNLQQWISDNARIEVKESQKIDLAYLPVIGLQNIEKSFARLMQWATPLGLMNAKTKMAIVYYDSLKITEPQNIRLNTCMVLSSLIEPTEEIGVMTIEKGKYIIGHFEITMPDFEKAWTGLYMWMNEKGYKRADKESFEIYHNNFNEHPDKKCIVDLYIPV